MTDIHRISSLAWAERSALELLQLRLSIRIEFHRTGPHPWMLTVLDEDLRRAYDDAEISRLDLVRALSELSAIAEDNEQPEADDLISTLDTIWPELFAEHFAVRKKLKTAIGTLETQSDALGLASKSDILRTAPLYTGRPALRAVPN